MKGLLLFFSIIFVLSACATIPTETELKESLGQRAEEYWKLRMGDRYEETYKMESKEGLLPFVEYRDKVSAMKRIKIISHSIKGAKVEGQEGIAEVEMSYISPPVPKPFKQILFDEWVYESGEWRHRLPRN